MAEPTRDDVDALVGPATPHFAYQIRARVRELVAELPADDDVRRYADQQMERLDRLGYASSKADEGPRESSARLVLGYMRNDRAAAEAAEEVRAAGAEPVLVRGNVTSRRVLDELAAAGPYDAVVHNAATGVIRPARETDDKPWDWTMNANARALLSLARVVAPSMPRGSTIAAISSLGSQRVLENYVLVGTSKAALESVVRYLAVELAPRGIRVNAVSAGVVETGALDFFPNREEMLRSVERTPAGRLVSPEDVAAAVSFLCSADAEMIRGQTLVLDGGFSLLA